MCETPLTPALGSGSCADESARRWLSAERGSAKPGLPNAAGMPGSAGLLGSAPTPGRAASRDCGLGQGCVRESWEKAAQSQTFALQETPQSGTHKATPKRPGGAASVHPLFVTPAGLSKKGSVRTPTPVRLGFSLAFHPGPSVGCVAGPSVSPGWV